VPTRAIAFFVRHNIEVEAKGARLCFRSGLVSRSGRKDLAGGVDQFGQLTQGISSPLA